MSALLVPGRPTPAAPRRGVAPPVGRLRHAVLRRELDRLFAAQPDLTDAQRTVIARTMSRLSNQLLHRPRAALCSAATAEGTAFLGSPDDLRRRRPSIDHL